MSSKDAISLEERIKGELYLNRADALAKHFLTVKTLLRIRPEDGGIHLLTPEVLSGKLRVLTYMVGKLFAHAADESHKGRVGNEELVRELGIRMGSLLPYLKRLRDEGFIAAQLEGKRSFHSVRLSCLDKAMECIVSSLAKHKKESEE